MKYRKLDDNGDMRFGHGLEDFWIDVPDAPAQAVVTRLGMYEGEWFLDRTAGTPWNTKVLGKYTDSTRDLVVRGRVLDTTGVYDVIQYSSAIDRNTRQFAVNMSIATIYGAANLRIGEPI
jgi:hypothetical protein